MIGPTARQLSLGAGVASLLICLPVLASPLITVRLLDFENYLAATRMLLGRENPYNVVEFFAPPWAALLFAPFTLLPTGVAAAAWLLLNVVAVGATGLLAFNWAAGRSPRPKAFLATLLLMIMPGALFSYITGQVSPLVSLGAVAAGWATATGRHRGLSLAGLILMTLKPHLAALLGLLVMLELARTRRWRLLLAVGVGLGSLTVVAFWLLPGWPAELACAWLAGDYRGGRPGLVSPGYAGLPELGIPLALFWPLAAYVLWLWWKEGLRPATAGLALTTSLLIVPYSRSYDFVVLILPLASLLEADSPGNRWLMGAGLGAAYALPLSNLSVLTPVALAILLLVRAGAARDANRKSLSPERRFDHN